MSRVRFRDPSGYVRIGEWEDETITFADRAYDPDEVDVLPPVESSKIVCLASNYVEHIKEGEGNPEKQETPSVFLKAPNAVASHGDTISLPTPRTSEEDLPDDYPIELGNRVDYEGEVGVVIGEQCRNVRQEEADDVIMGYTCMNDISNRDDQAVHGNDFRGKAFDGAIPIGPVIAPPDRVPDDPRVRLWVNGELKQDSADDRMLFSIAEAIEEITQFITLEPGDVISMGTTYGVGPLHDGDTVEVSVEGVGPRLRHSVTRD